MGKLRSVEELEAWRAACTQAGYPARPCLSVCAGSGCTASGARDVLRALQRNLQRRGLENIVELKSTGCHGFCERGPLVVVWPEGIFYNRVTPGDASELAASVGDGRRPVERLLYQDPVSGARILHEEDVPFYRRQQRVLLANNGKIDPRSIEDYLRVGGYTSGAFRLHPRTGDRMGETLGPARAGRGRLPHRREMGGVPGSPGSHEVPHL